MHVETFLRLSKPALSFSLYVVYLILITLLGANIRLIKTITVKVEILKQRFNFLRIIMTRMY